MRGYIAGRAWLYCRKSAVILPEERGYMEEEHGYIAGRARLYCHIFVMKIVAYLSCSAGRTHFARTKITQR